MNTVNLVKQEASSIGLPYSRDLLSSKSRALANSPELQICQEIESLYQQLDSLDSLNPSEQVNRLFSRLVELATTEKCEFVDHILSHPGIEAIRQDLQKVCSLGEYALELHWTRLILESSCPEEMLLQFPYYQNYQLLSQLEHYSIQAVSQVPLQKVLFVGSGPLPLTSIFLARDYGLQVHNLDLDDEAYHLSSKLSNRLGLSSFLQFTHQDILDFDDFDKYDVIFLAALVGQTQKEKKKIIQHLAEKMRPKARVILRSSTQLKKLLYPPVDLQDLSGLQLLTEIHPHNEVVNSLIIARKLEGV